MARRCSTDQVRILLALAGLHRVDRGAEVAFISVGRELARAGHEVTLIGSGPPRSVDPYRFIHAPGVSRQRFERFPSLPLVRNETAWEELSFVPGLLAKYRPRDFDITATCAYPFTNWALRRPVFGGKAPPHVFITQNGDWPATSNNAEYRFFDCDGLVCTNPDYFERNRERYRTALIPNGVDLKRFRPGQAERERFGLPSGPLVLMVSALIASKNVADGIAAVSRIPDATLVVAGDGPLRDELKRLAAQVLPGRYHQLSVAAADMPALYRSADLFLHLSLEESFGNVFVEAMASGLPIVGYDVPRSRWIVGDKAYFADPSRPDGVIASVRAALATGPGMGERMRERSQQFGWPAIAERYADFFSELLR